MRSPSLTPLQKREEPGEDGREGLVCFLACFVQIFGHDPGYRFRKATENSGPPR